MPGSKPFLFFLVPGLPLLFGLNRQFSGFFLSYSSKLSDLDFQRSSHCPEALHISITECTFWWGYPKWKGQHWNNSWHNLLSYCNIHNRQYIQEGRILEYGPIV